MIVQNKYLQIQSMNYKMLIFIHKKYSLLEFSLIRKLFVNNMKKIEMASCFRSK